MTETDKFYKVECPRKQQYSKKKSNHQLNNLLHNTIFYIKTIYFTVHLFLTTKFQLPHPQLNQPQNSISFCTPSIKI